MTKIVGPIIVRTEVRKRGAFGKGFTLLFVLFNCLMLDCLISYWIEIARLGKETSSATHPALVIGATTISAEMLMGLWIAGDIILGILTLLLRRRDHKRETAQ